MQYPFRILILLLCLVVAPVSTLAQGVNDFAYVNTQLMNLRSGPSANSRVVTELGRGTRVLVTAIDGSWARIVAGADNSFAKGYLSLRYLSPIDTSENQVAVAPPAMPAPVAPPVAAAPRPLSMMTRSFDDPLSISDIDFDCDESYIDDGLNDCTAEVEVSIRIPRVFAPYAARSVDVRCEGEISYETADGYGMNTENADETEAVYISSGYGSATIDLDFDFGLNFSQVTSAKLSDVICEAY